MLNAFFHHRIKHTVGDPGTWDKGVEVKNSYEDAKQAYHAYLGAYAYGKSADTDYVSCEITDISGTCLERETWIAPEPEA